MLDYKLIEAYANVLQEGGFEKAARKLGLTQSAVSQRIRHIEEQFGRIALLRTTPPQPTELGRKILRLYYQVRRLEDDFHRSSTAAPTPSFTSLPVGLNADSLATWFFDAVQPFLQQHQAVLDMKIDDQEETHRFLKEGKVLGCISTSSSPMQGCSARYLGEVGYGLFCSPDFGDRWFARGITPEAVLHAPMINYNRKDRININILTRMLGKEPEYSSCFYVPSSEQFVNFISNSYAYGALPEQQSRQPMKNGLIHELAPQHRFSLPLYWHCWNLDSDILRSLSDHIVQGFSRIRQ